MASDGAGERAGTLYYRLAQEASHVRTPAGQNYRVRILAVYRRLGEREPWNYEVVVYRAHEDGTAFGVGHEELASPFRGLTEAARDRLCAAITAGDAATLRALDWHLDEAW